MPQEAYTEFTIKLMEAIKEIGNRLIKHMAPEPGIKTHQLTLGKEI